MVWKGTRAQNKSSMNAVLLVNANIGFSENLFLVPSCSEFSLGPVETVSPTGDVVEVVDEACTPWLCYLTHKDHSLYTSTPPQTRSVSLRLSSLVGGGSTSSLFYFPDLSLEKLFFRGVWEVSLCGSDFCLLESGGTETHMVV